MDRRIIVFFLATAATVAVLTIVKNTFFPPPPVPTQPSVAIAAATKPQAKPVPEAAALALLNGMNAVPAKLLHPVPDEPSMGLLRRQAEAAQAEAKRQARLAELAKLPDPTLELGNDFIRVVLSEQGAAVKSVTLKQHQTATRDYARPDPKRPELLLITDDDDGKLKELDPLRRQERQSFRFHVPGETLAWKVVEKGPRQVVFEADLPSKNLKVRRAFTVKPGFYHVDLAITLQPLDGGKADIVYEMTGPHGLNIEGIQWKQTSFRQVATLDVNPNDTRDLERRIDEAMHLDPARNQNKQVKPHVFNDPKNDRIFQFTGVMNQFFAALMIARNGEVTNGMVPAPPRWVDRVIPYYAGEDQDVPAHQVRMKLQGKVGCKLVSLPVKLDGKPVTHEYLLFTGPCKTLLLDYEPGIAPEAEQFYTQQHHLRMLTEAPFDHPISRFSYNVGWSSLVVWCTNTMHRLLEFLYRLFGSYGVAILVMTLIVRMLMFPISRRQAMNARDMSEKMAKLKPELKKLDEKYKNDAHGKAAAHMELMRKHGVNPLSSCTGCLVVFLQMPIFMGLYYALNESTHLRLAGFLWFPNLAAPDMLAHWGNMPGFSALAQGLNLGLFYLTLGDFFNLLPIVSVALMYFQQKMMMPPAMDEQQAMQMKMMNWMLLLMGYAFYWVASGLCMYFIVSSAWGMLERKLLPKKPAESSSPAVSKASPSGKTGKEKAPAAAKNGKPSMGKQISDLWQKLLREADKK